MLELLRHVLFIIGTGLAIAGVFADNTTPGSWLGRRLAPRFEAAKAGDGKLLSKENQKIQRPLVPPGDLNLWRTSDLSRGEPGFTELLDIVNARVPVTGKGVADTVRLGFHKQLRQRPGSIVAEAVAYIRLEALQGGRELAAIEIGRRRADMDLGFDYDAEEDILEDLKKTVQSRFFDDYVRRRSIILAVVGIALAVLMYIVEVFTDRQEQKARAFQ